MITGELEDVMPLEDAGLHSAAYPTNNGFKFDGAASAAREREMVRRILQAGPVFMVILGGAHDLTEEIKAVYPRCEFVVIGVNAIRRGAMERVQEAHI